MRAHARDDRQPRCGAQHAAAVAGVARSASAAWRPHLTSHEPSAAGGDAQVDALCRRHRGGSSIPPGSLACAPGARSFASFGRASRLRVGSSSMIAIPPCFAGTWSLEMVEPTGRRRRSRELASLRWHRLVARSFFRPWSLTAWPTYVRAHRVAGRCTAWLRACRATSESFQRERRRHVDRRCPVSLHPRRTGCTTRTASQQPDDLGRIEKERTRRGLQRTRAARWRYRRSRLQRVLVHRHCLIKSLDAQARRSRWGLRNCTRRRRGWVRSVGMRRLDTAPSSVRSNRRVARMAASVDRRPGSPTDHAARGASNGHAAAAGSANARNRRIATPGYAISRRAHFRLSAPSGGTSDCRARKLKLLALPELARTLRFVDASFTI